MSELIVFDGDGLLWSSYDAYLAATREILGRKGVYLDEKELTGEMMAEGVAFTLKQFLGERDDIADLRQEVGKIAIDYMGNHKKETLCPGAIELLYKVEELEKKSALVTNSSELVTEWILKNTDLSTFTFDWISPRSTPKSTESKEERITKIMNEAKVTPEETLMIDDSPVGVRIAKNLNCDVILVLHEQSWHHKTPEKEPIPEDIKIVYHLSDIELD